jgi:hypothetical protein
LFVTVEEEKAIASSCSALSGQALQEIRIERFNDELIKACFERSTPVLVLPISGNRDYAYVGTQEPPNLPRRVVTAHLRHCDVQKHDIGPHPSGNFYARAAVMGDIDLVAHCAQYQRERIGGIDVVINDEHFPLN